MTAEERKSKADRFRELIGGASPCQVFAPLDWAMFHEEHIDPTLLEQWLALHSHFCAEGQSLADLVQEVYGAEARVLADDLM